MHCIRFYHPEILPDFQLGTAMGYYTFCPCMESPRVQQSGIKAPTNRVYFKQDFTCFR